MSKVLILNLNIAAWWTVKKTKNKFEYKLQQDANIRYLQRGDGKCIVKSFINFSLHQMVLGNKIEKYKMGGSYSMHGGVT
jgi:hypothetical protein